MKIAEKDRATVRPVGVGTLSNRAPQRNRPPVRLPPFRPPERLRRPDPERRPPRTRLTRLSAEKLRHIPHMAQAGRPFVESAKALGKPSPPLQPPFDLGRQRRSEPSGIPIVLMLLPVIEVPTSFLYGANWGEPRVVHHREAGRHRDAQSAGHTHVRRVRHSPREARR
jgi:hypothetical protein